jgi:hypothetical protein
MMQMMKGVERASGGRGRGRRVNEGERMMMDEKWNIFERNIGNDPGKFSGFIMPE